jgi:cyclic pyranopterin phosphate synthase
MQDTFGRNIDYLRISVTEACNFRCTYCTPDGHGRLSTPPLTVEEIERIVRAAVALGMTNIRLTGGEPLLRRDIIEIVRAILMIEDVRDLALTTNGFFLTRYAQPLADAGLRRINISLDTLQRGRFAEISGMDAFEQVWGGIGAAEEAGFAPLKINVVLLRGLNDDQVADLANLTIERAWHVRFIELMPVGSSEAAREFFAKRFIPASEIRARLPQLVAIASPRGNGPARTYRLPNARGTIGFITPTSEHFCGTCNRIRIMPNGEARSCLFGGNGVDLRSALCKGADESSLQQLLAQAICAKPLHHPWGKEFRIVAGAMSEIGG